MSGVNRIIFFIIGMPITSFCLFISIHGFIVGYGGIVEGSVIMILMGLLTVTGLIGVIGAWIKVLAPNKSTEHATVIKGMITSGVLTCFVLSVWVLYEGVVNLSIGLLLLGGLGVWLLLHSSNPNKRLWRQ